MSLITIDGVRNFDLVHTFECGQCFRWNRNPDGSYTGLAGSYPASMRLEGTRLTIDDAACAGEGFWRRYLDLDRDYGAVKNRLAKADPVLGTAIRAGEGIHILKQDLWETIVSFIISQNNNIPRIKGCIEELADRYGRPVFAFEGRKRSALPQPETLAKLTLEDLMPVKLGYRARYLIETAKQVLEKGLPADREGLLMLSGVGPKVANCIALFALGDTESFPIDVWVARIMASLYGMEEKDHKAMAAYAEKTYGKLGGFAQQYLFYYARD